MNCGERYQDMIDHHSYTQHNIGSCEINPEKTSSNQHTFFFELHYLTKIFMVLRLPKTKLDQNGQKNNLQNNVLASVFQIV